MPQVVAVATSAVATTAADDRVCQELTKSVLTLQQTIRNIREDVANGIAPSILLPIEPTQDVNAGMVMLTLEPSATDIQSHLGPLDSRLQNVERTLRACAQWHSPRVHPKSPEYSIIDISDLSSAVKLLEDVVQHISSSKPISPRIFLSQYEWTWDALWKEFYTQMASQSSLLYLSRWRLDELRQVWEHVSMNGADVLPDYAAEMMGSWEDWTWDPLGKEWYLDVSDKEVQCRVYVSQWEVQDNGQWIYVGRSGTQ